MGGIEEIYIPKSIKHIDKVSFTESHRTQKIIISPQNKYYYGNGKELIEKRIKNLLLLAVNSKIPDGVKRVCTTVPFLTKKIIVPDSVTEIESFRFCCSLAESIKLSKNLKTIRPNTFLYCSELKEITIPENVKSIGENNFSRDEDVLEKIIIEGKETFLRKASIPKNVVIYCKKGSRAEKYAIRNKNKCIII